MDQPQIRQKPQGKGYEPQGDHAAGRPFYVVIAFDCSDVGMKKACHF